MAKVLKHTEAYNNAPFVEFFKKGIVDLYGEFKGIPAITFIYNFEELRVGYFALSQPRLSSSEEKALKEFGFNPDDIRERVDICIDNSLLTECGLDWKVFKAFEQEQFYGSKGVIIEIAYEYGKNLLPHQIKHIESLGYKHICGNKFLVGRNL